jgi:hypothetical protein
MARRRLTVRQTQVLAALERTGKTTLLYLRDVQLPWLSQSELWGVVRALIERGLLESEGDPHWVYAGSRETFERAGIEPPKGFEPFYIWPATGGPRLTRRSA